MPPVSSAAAAVVVVRHAHEGIAPLDGVVSDTSCRARPLTWLDAPNAACLTTTPLQPLHLAQYVVPRPAAADAVAPGLPFDLSGHPDAQCAIAKDMLARLQGDMKGCAYPHIPNRAL
jgi:hypothetical protein